MTDIEKLRDAVIEAARNAFLYGGLQGTALVEIGVAVNALDEAEKPGPWALLREARRACYLTDAAADKAKRHFIAGVDAALAWKERNDG